MLEGPAAVVAATLQRIGWKAEDAAQWTTARGDGVLLDEVCPKDVTKLIELDATRHAWEQAIPHHDIYAHLDGMPLLDPIIDLLRRTGTSWGTCEQQALQALVADAFVFPDLCPRCGVLAPRGGGARHFFWECDATAAFRRQYGMSSAMVTARASSPELAIWHTALVSDPRMLLPKPATEAIVQ
eukprot:750397-Karenia_brevis.AAC.1